MKEYEKGGLEPGSGDSDSSRFRAGCLARDALWSGVFGLEVR